MAAAPAAVHSISPKDIWDALTSAGFSAVQAAGVMGNMISESSLNVESAAMDSNGAMAYGLVSWNAASYPNASGLVTGHPAADLKRQVDFLASSGGRAAASGTTVRETAGNFASGYERCQGCQSGGSQWTTRVSQALTVAAWAASGSWPAGKGQASTTATLTAAQVAEQTKGQKTCAWSVGWGGIPGTSWLSWLFGGSTDVGAGEICLLSKAQARALAGFGVLGAGIFVGFAGVQIISAAAALDVLKRLAQLRAGTLPSGGGGGSGPPAASGSAGGGQPSPSGSGVPESARG